MNRKPDQPKVPKEVEQAINEAKRSREEMARELEENAILEQIRRAMRGDGN